MRIRLLFTILAIMSAVNLFGQDLDAQYATTLLPKGTQAPDFTLNNLDGKPFRLSSLRGRRVVLVFWASWCPDCRAEVPELKTMYGKGGEGLQRQVHQANGGHGFYNYGGAEGEAYVVAAGDTGFGYAGCWFECNAEHNGIAVGDAAVHPTGMVGDRWQNAPVPAAAMM